MPTKKDIAKEIAAFELNSIDQGVATDADLKDIAYNDFFKIVDKYHAEIVKEFTDHVDNQEAYKKKGLTASLSKAVLSLGDPAEMTLTKINNSKESSVSDHKGRVTYVALYSQCLREAVTNSETITKWKKYQKIQDTKTVELLNLGRALGATSESDQIKAELKDAKSIFKKALGVSLTSVNAAKLKG